jgi:glycosyltransferase involved in cell wall biosynthesis
MPVSALILTLNEEKNLPGCIASLRWANDIVVLDSGSTDRTVELAASLGCRVFHRAFDNWSAHQRWAVRNLPFRHPWVLNIDADERVPGELAGEIAAAVAAPGCAAFRIRRRDYFQGVWLKHATFYPTWLVRLYRPPAVRFERLVNPVTCVEGPVGELRNHIDHWPFSKGIDHWVERHNAYSNFEAREYTGRRPLEWRGLFLPEPNRRRQALKSLFSRMPFRPAIKFAYLYLLHGGWLDGRAGFDYSVLQSFYEYLISVKVAELRGRSEKAA